jgi:hypothetical protein
MNFEAAGATGIKVEAAEYVDLSLQVVLSSENTIV